ncbi:hypothetical protein I5G59_gp84 [Mycobacterium phage LilMcDreamy]|uniref:Uncharacterized protein n=1 Tax=Mycobacterium phage LilMcDreamy TaxID=2652422 RepID=A0A5P8D6Q4_9CAUD|nr:hypothetical protein I5G59_gp84 [Mycobacterium phage LilMcDreamy]QFP94704.1 hypothetical protein SEA_LILMCDREAMY_84 [Mycobacterium phage LilMcDreamy]
MQDAKQFLDEVADRLRGMGRTVEITTTQESFGEFVWLFAAAPHWADRTISLSASKSARTGRWSLGPLTVGPSGGTGPKSRGFKRESRGDISNAVAVYGRVI